MQDFSYSEDETKHPIALSTIYNEPYYTLYNTNTRFLMSNGRCPSCANAKYKIDTLGYKLISYAALSLVQSN